MISSSSFSSAPSSCFDACVDDAVELNYFFKLNQQNVKEKDSLSETSSISRSSSDQEWTSDAEEWSTDSDDDDDEMSSIKAEDDDDDSCFQKKELVTEPSLEDRNDAYAQRVKRFKNNKPSFQGWIDSWSELRTPLGHWLSVYGYCDKNRGYGGYAVILRNNWLRPVAAATFFTPEGGRSQLFQVLNGLNAGFDLLVEQQNPLVYVVCNVKKAVDLLGSLTFQEAGRCYARDGSSSHVKKEGICKECTKRRVLMKTATFESLIPLIAKLKKLQAVVNSFPFLFSKVSRAENEAAHYLAKTAKVEAHGVESQKVIKPADFPPKLQKILYDDAFGFNTRYCRALNIHEEMAYKKQQIEQKSVF